MLIESHSGFINSIGDKQAGTQWAVLDDSKGTSQSLLKEVSSKSLTSGSFVNG